MWSVLKIRARQTGTTMSDLVRQAVTEKFLSGAEERHRALRAIAGMWADRKDIPDTADLVREMRRDSRASRLFQK